MTMSAEIAAGFRQVAADQIAQDIENAAKFALKSETGDGHAVAVQQLIGFYNGYTGSALDYRDYLTLTTDDCLTAWYDFGNSYLGTS